MKRDRRLSEKQSFCGFSKAQTLGDRPKDLQAKVFELCHLKIIHRNGEAREPIVVQAEYRESGSDQRVFRIDTGKRALVLMNCSGNLPDGLPTGDRAMQIHH